MPWHNLASVANTNQHTTESSSSVPCHSGSVSARHEGHRDEKVELLPKGSKTNAATTSGSDEQERRTSKATTAG